MAGTHRSGFRAARSNLYAGSPMVLVPLPIYDPSVIARAQEALSVVGFGSFSCDHDARNAPGSPYRVHFRSSRTS